MEFSPFAWEIESEQTAFLRTAREFGMRIVAAGPRLPYRRHHPGGSIWTPPPSRWNYPRFSPTAFGENLRLVKAIADLASRTAVPYGTMDAGVRSEDRRVPRSRSGVPGTK